MASTPAAPTVPAAAASAQAPQANPTGGEHQFRGGGGGRGRGRGWGRGRARGFGGRAARSGRGRDSGRFQGYVKRSNITSDAEYQKNLRLDVGVAVQREHFNKGFLQNYGGEFGHDIARCIEQDYWHQYDEGGWRREHTLPPALDDYDFVNDPAARFQYKRDLDECKSLADFFDKREKLNGKIRENMSSELHERVLDKFGPDFFNGETVTSVLMDGIQEMMVPDGFDRPKVINQLKLERLNFKQYDGEKPRSFISRAKELRARFDLYKEPFDEPEFVKGIMVPGVSLPYREVADQQRKFSEYPIPDQADASQWAIYIAIVQPVNTLDELLERLQKVVPAQNPFDYLNAAVVDRKRAREDDDERRPKKAGRDRRPKKAGQSRGRVEELPNRDRVTCHRCGVFGHRAKQCTARVVDSANFFGEE